jgi:hypothetical protein
LLDGILRCSLASEDSTRLPDHGNFLMRASSPQLPEDPSYFIMIRRVFVIVAMSLREITIRTIGGITRPSNEQAISPTRRVDIRIVSMSNGPATAQRNICEAAIRLLACTSLAI